MREPDALASRPGVSVELAQSRDRVGDLLHLVLGNGEPQEERLGCPYYGFLEAARADSPTIASGCATTTAGKSKLE